MHTIFKKAHGGVDSSFMTFYHCCQNALIIKVTLEEVKPMLAKKSKQPRREEGWFGKKWGPSNMNIEDGGKGKCTRPMLQAGSRVVWGGG